MNRRRISLTTLIVLVMVASLTGCATGPKMTLTTSVADGERLQIMWVHGYKEKDGLRVQGHVRRAAQTYGAIKGHLHVVGYFADGAQPVVADTRWGPLPSRGSRMARFNVLLRTVNPGGIDRIAVEYRLNSKDT